MLRISEKLLQQITAECERCYPLEACGFIFGKAGGEADRIRLAQNIQDDLHQHDSIRYSRTAQTAYTIDPKETAQAEEGAKKLGLKMISIFHSHPDHEVYFSDEDKAMAAPWGEPLFPELSYLVVSVYGKKVKNASEFYWNLLKKDFVEKKIL